MIELQSSRGASQVRHACLRCLTGASFCLRTEKATQRQQDLNTYFEGMHTTLQQFRNEKINAIYADSRIENKEVAVNDAYHQDLFEISKDQREKNIKTEYKISIPHPKYPEDRNQYEMLYLPRELSGLPVLEPLYGAPTQTFQTDFEATLDARVLALRSKLPKDKPVIICVEGPPVGYGKTSFSEKLAKAPHFSHLNFDQDKEASKDEPHKQIEKYKYSREIRTNGFPGTNKPLKGFEQYDLERIIKDVQEKIKQDESVVLDGVYSAHPDILKAIVTLGVSVVRVGMFRAEDSFMKRYENKRAQKADLVSYQQMEMMLFVHKLEASYAFGACESGKMDFVFTDEGVYERKGICSRVWQLFFNTQ